MQDTAPKLLLFKVPPIAWQSNGFNAVNVLALLTPKDKHASAINIDKGNNPAPKVNNITPAIILMMYDVHSPHEQQ